MEGFESGNKVQAFDSVLGQWLNGTVLEVDDGKVQIHWAGYNRFFDVWLDALEVRKPEDERPLDRRRPVLKSNFPKRQHPKHLQKDDFVRVFENQDWSEAQTVSKNDCFKGEVTLVSGRVVRYEYLKEHAEKGSRDEVPSSEQKAFDLLRKEKSKEESKMYLLGSDDEACSTDEDSAFPELQDVGSDEERTTKDDESDFPDPHDFEKIWDEDEIDDVLEKLTFEDALKELRQNQEKLLENQNAIQKSLTAIEALLNTRLQKRKQAMQVATLPSVPARPSSSDSVTPLSWEDSTAPLVSRVSAPPVTPPSSQMVPLNHSNSTGVKENPCFSAALYNQSPPNIMSNEDARIESIPSSLATYSGPDQFSHDFSTRFSTSTGQMGGRLCSSAGTPNNSSSSNLTNEGVTPAEYTHPLLATYNGPISRDLINLAVANSTNCKTFVFKLMDGMFNKQELASSSLSGGVRKYKGVTSIKQGLSPNRMKNIFRAAKLRYPTEFAKVANTPEFREAINMKCRKTVFKADTN